MILRWRHSGFIDVFHRPIQGKDATSCVSYVFCFECTFYVLLKQFSTFVHFSSTLSRLVCTKISIDASLLLMTRIARKKPKQPTYTHEGWRTETCPVFLCLYDTRVVNLNSIPRRVKNECLFLKTRKHTQEQQTCLVSSTRDDTRSEAWLKIFTIICLREHNSFWLDSKSTVIPEHDDKQFEDVYHGRIRKT
jgi:hypothetical protein